MKGASDLMSRLNRVSYITTVNFLCITVMYVLYITVVYVLSV